MVQTGYGGKFSPDISDIAIQYTSLQELNLNEARSLYVEIMENLLKLFNNDKEVRPYLRNYPLTFNNVSLSISFEDVNHDCIKNDKITSISLIKGIIYYCIYDEMSLIHLKDIHSEKYEEALEFVRKENLISILNG